jgi:hypothetical protein
MEHELLIAIDEVGMHAPAAGLASW